MVALLLMPRLWPVLYRATVAALMGWPEVRPADEQDTAD